MKKLKFHRDNDKVVSVIEGKHVIGEIVSLDDEWFFEGTIGISISESNLRQIAKYMKSLRAANLPKTKTDDSGPVVTGTLKVEKPHTMTPGFVAQGPQTVRYPNFDPVRQATVAFPEPDPVQKMVMTPGFVAQEPKVAAFTTEPDGKVTIAYDVRQPGTVTHHATAASSRMVMPGTASIRFVIENRDYTLDITGVIVGENASVELRQENDAWSL